MNSQTIEDKLKVNYTERENGGTIGEGGTAYVKLYKSKTSGEKVAVKIINKNNPEVKKLTEKINNEIEAMNNLKHPNIISAVEVLETEDTIAIVMPYCEDGDLLEYVLNQGKIPENDARDLFRQIVDAVEYAHSQGYCHRDLKLENIFLHSGYKKAVVGDWGFSTKYKSNVESLTDSCGSLPFAAPELLRGAAYEGPEIDAWSLGVLLYSLVVGKYPFDSTNENMLRDKIKKVQYADPRGSSSELKQLIKGLLHPDRNERITVTEIKIQSWMRQGGKQ